MHYFLHRVYKASILYIRATVYPLTCFRCRQTGPVREGRNVPWFSLSCLNFYFIIELIIFIRIAHIGTQIKGNNNTYEQKKWHGACHYSNDEEMLL